MAESTSFIGVFPASFTRGSGKRTRRFVRQEDIDALQRLTGVDLFMYKMTSPVVARRKTAKLARRLVVPRRRERPTQPGERQTVRLHGNSVRDVDAGSASVPPPAGCAATKSKSSLLPLIQ